MKILVPAFAFGLSVCCASLPVSAGAFEDCASTTAATAIAGCTQVLKTAKIKKSEQSLVYAMRGLSYLNAGEPQLAIKDLEKSVALNAKNFQAFQALGLALQSTGLYAESIAAFDSAIALKPSDATTISYRGYSHMLSKNFKASLADFDAAVKLQPKNPSLHTARGDVLKKIGGLPVALAAYSKAIALDPNYASAYEGRGLVHLVLANADAALADLDKAVERNAKSSLAYAARAKAHYLRNEIDQGLTDAAKATELAPNDAYMQAALGTGYLSQGDYAKAAEIFQAAIVAESSSAPALRGAALAALAMDDADTTIALTDTALLQKPEDLQPYATRGHAVLRKGRVDEAISNFEKALSGDNLDGEAYWGLGLAYAQKGEIEKAKANLAESLKPYRLLPYQKSMAEQAMQKLVAGDGSKSDLQKRVAVTEPQVDTPLTTPPAKNADPGKRVALVIGNGTYLNANSLANPARDAAAISASLKQLGFEVFEGNDLTQAKMQSLLQSFAEKATEADVALFYYAGHGMQVGDKNYLIPTDAKLEQASAVEFELVDVNKSVVQFMGGEQRTGIVILDSCRDNPLSRSFARNFKKTRSGQVAQGMAPMSAEDGGLLIAFATSPGAVAEDGEGQNSPFTTALLQHMSTPGIELEQMMKRVRRDVYNATDKRQQPWVNSALRDDVYLAVK